MSLSFQERFRNRSSFIGKQGDVQVKGDFSVAKPLNHQLFTEKNPRIYPASPPIAASAETSKRFPARPNKIPHPFNRNQSKSANPFERQGPNPKIDVKKSPILCEYKPYTLKDYQIIKSEKYYELGGLGPSNIGSADWKNKKEKSEKRFSYAKHVNFSNFSLPVLSKPKELEIVPRVKAFQFVRMVPEKSPKKSLDENEEFIYKNQIRTMRSLNF